MTHNLLGFVLVVATALQPLAVKLHDGAGACGGHAHDAAASVHESSAHGHDVHRHDCDSCPLCAAKSNPNCLEALCAPRLDVSLDRHSGLRLEAQVRNKWIEFLCPLSRAPPSSFSHL